MISSKTNNIEQFSCKLNRAGYAAAIWSSVTGKPYRFQSPEAGNILPCSGNDPPIIGHGQKSDSVFELLSNFNLEPVPNPASERFSLNFEREISGQLFVFNSLGQFVYSDNFARIQNIEVSTAGWTSGMHYLYLLLTTGKSQTGKILIQN